MVLGPRDFHLQRAPNEALRALLGDLVHNRVQVVQAVCLYQVCHLRAAASIQAGQCKRTAGCYADSELQMSQASPGRLSNTAPLKLHEG